MANRERGEARLVSLAGEVYTLRVTTNACCDVEDLSGKAWPLIVAGVMRDRMTDFRWLLWAALQEYHGEVVKSPKDAGRVIDACGGLEAVSKQLQDFVLLNNEPADPQDAAAATANPPSAQTESVGVGSTLPLVKSA